MYNDFVPKKTFYSRAILRPPTAFTKNPGLTKIWIGFFLLTGLAGLGLWLGQKYQDWLKEKSKFKLKDLLDIRNKTTRRFLILLVACLTSALISLNIDEISRIISQAELSKGLVKVINTGPIFQPVDYNSFYKSQMRKQRDALDGQEALREEALDEVTESNLRMIMTGFTFLITLSSGLFLILTANDDIMEKQEVKKEAVEEPSKAADAPIDGDDDQLQK